MTNTKALVVHRLPDGSQVYINDMELAKIFIEKLATASSTSTLGARSTASPSCTVASSMASTSPPPTPPRQDLPATPELPVKNTFIHFDMFSNDESMEAAVQTDQPSTASIAIQSTPMSTPKPRRGRVNGRATQTSSVDDSMAASASTIDIAETPINDADSSKCTARNLVGKRVETVGEARLTYRAALGPLRTVTSRSIKFVVHDIDTDDCERCVLLVTSDGDDTVYKLDADVSYTIC
eukprot:gnl/TRDRNA2_/TRDRNA2_125560_c0_seq1.p1 gnl/TRDRNA2_/TRDRNA2_125560_c0~~gnl/TRDRNA2_/TRDRNA2_125560_c0_seq1.p1  ORF type:complete len:238 (-),score=27.22 gnl/TRDRNA2_/TRDRNA2_125560_c0_seq1:215-928(-)